MRQYEFINISKLMDQGGLKLVRVTKDCDIYAVPGSNIEITVPRKSICIRTTA